MSDKAKKSDKVEVQLPSNALAKVIMKDLKNAVSVKADIQAAALKPKTAALAKLSEKANFTLQKWHHVLVTNKSMDIVYIWDSRLVVGCIPAGVIDPKTDCIKNLRDNGQALIIDDKSLLDSKLK